MTTYTFQSTSSLKAYMTTAILADRKVMIHRNGRTCPRQEEFWNSPVKPRYSRVLGPREFTLLYLYGKLSKSYKKILFYSKSYYNNIIYDYLTFCIKCNKNQTFLVLKILLYMEAKIRDICNSLKSLKICGPFLF